LKAGTRSGGFALLEFSKTGFGRRHLTLGWNKFQAKCNKMFKPLGKGRSKHHFFIAQTTRESNAGFTSNYSPED
jgi:hypothetical protein